MKRKPLTDHEIAIVGFGVGCAVLALMVCVAVGIRMLLR